MAIASERLPSMRKLLRHCLERGAGGTGQDLWFRRMSVGLLRSLQAWQPSIHRIDAV